MQIDAYLNYIVSVRRYSLRTRDIYRSVLEGFRERGEALTTTGLRNYEVYLLEDKKETPRTVNLHLSVLSSYCRWAVNNGLIQTNPVKLVPKPKTEKRLPVFYRKDSLEGYFSSTEYSVSREQLDFLRSLPVSDKTATLLYYRRLRRLIISILYSTGIRRSELIGLNIGSVDFSRRNLSVCGKGNKMREIPLTSSLCEEILLYLSAAEHLLGEAKGSKTPLLRTQKGSRLYPVYCDRAVKEELKGVVTGQKSPHILRHTLATNLLDEGTNLNSIKELLGHSSLAATQVYTHNSMERLRKEYDKAHPRAKNDSYGDKT